jgi:hypothetical protein
LLRLGRRGAGSFDKVVREVVGSRTADCNAGIKTANEGVVASSSIERVVIATTVDRVVARAENRILASKAK